MGPGPGPMGPLVRAQKLALWHGQKKSGAHPRRGVTQPRQTGATFFNVCPGQRAFFCPDQSVLLSYYGLFLDYYIILHIF